MIIEVSRPEEIDGGIDDTVNKSDVHLHSYNGDMQVPSVERTYQLNGSLRRECLRMRGSYARITYSLGYYKDYE